MRCDTPSLPVAVAAVLGLAFPQMSVPAAAASAVVSLCGGGTVHLALGGRGGPDNAPGGCHAACALRRDDEERQDRGAPA